MRCFGARRHPCPTPRAGRCEVRSGDDDHGTRQHANGDHGEYPVGRATPAGQPGAVPRGEPGAPLERDARRDLHGVNRSGGHLAREDAIRGSVEPRTRRSRPLARRRLSRRTGPRRARRADAASAPRDTRSVPTAMSVGGGSMRVTTPYVGVAASGSPKGSGNATRRGFHPQARNPETAGLWITRRVPARIRGSPGHPAGDERWRNPWKTTRM